MVTTEPNDNKINSPVDQCTDCGTSTKSRLFSFFGGTNATNCDRMGCPSKLCPSCFNRRPLMVVLDGEETENNKRMIRSFCQKCFSEYSVLDLSRNYDIIKPPPTMENNDPGNPNDGARTSSSSGRTFIFAHGGGGSRAMFRAHAEALAERFGHESILWDLPGHGANVEIPLTLDSCASMLEQILQLNQIPPATIAEAAGKKTIYVGGSLGAYIGFDLLHRYREFFSGAILLDCGQNVGPDASLKARLGLWFLELVGNSWSNKTMMKLMYDTSRKSADYKLVETCFGAGMFFDQASGQVACLRAVAPANLIPHLPFPLLFMNGTEDYRDSEDLWLSLCTVKEGSELKDYDKGDHFFMHNTRFVDDILKRWDAFARSDRTKVVAVSSSVA